MSARRRRSGRTARSGRDIGEPTIVLAAAMVGLIAAAVALTACGAPASSPATGPVADEIRAALTSGSATFDHTEWDRLLAGGTENGLVDYAFMRSNRGALDGYLDRIAVADLASLAGDELKALLINAYNAITVRVILDNPGVSSIREIDGAWTDIRHAFGGHELTLDNLEHNLLRPFFKDPRIHFAVNCASMSCAPLPGWAFEGAELEEQLEERSTSFVSDTRNVRVEDGRLVVSRYFDWYGDDFTAEGWSPRAETIAGFIQRYADAEVGELISSAGENVPLEFTDYDWSLNSADRAGAGASAPGAHGAAVPGVGAGIGPDPDTGGWVARVREWVAGFGPAAPLAYGLIYVLAVVLLIPGSSLTIGAGFAFGLGLGTLVVVISANIGAALAFLLGRYLLRRRVERWLEGREKLSAVDRAVEGQGWRVVALTRLSPAFPFNVQNYFYGLTGVRFWSYVLASLFAMLPGTLLYVYVGVAGAEVASALGGAASWGRTALLVAGLLATLVVVVLVTRVAKRELEKVTRESTGDVAASSRGQDSSRGQEVSLRA
jgi:uncharacterized membrane protein YdjX (TVP38/TMEM64 family)